ncbi:hypothetical protein GQ457_01G021780 [Hibiscus cannabinus]
MASDSSGVVCGAVNESVDHILRRCPPSLLVWKEFIKPYQLDAFLEIDLCLWVAANVSDVSRFPVRASNWDIMFGTTLWNLWLTRNVTVFNSPFHDCQRVIECRATGGMSCVGLGEWSCEPKYGAGYVQDGYACCGGVAQNSRGDGLSRHSVLYAFGFCSSSVTHVRRDGNCVADACARKASSTSFETTLFYTPSDSVLHLLHADSLTGGT